MFDEARPLPQRLGVPPLYDRIAQVMGRDTIACQEVIKRLEDNAWMPSSTDAGGYISLLLSTNVPGVFQRVKRGKYRVSESYSPGFGPKAKQVNAVKKNPPKSQAKPKPPPALSTLPENLPLVIAFEGTDAAWIIERSAALGKTPKEYVISHLQTDMRKMISQIRVQSFRRSDKKPPVKPQDK